MPQSDATFDLQDARQRIVAAALPHVPFDGWSEATLRTAAADAGFDAVTALRVFPRGAVEAVEFWIADADRRMVEALTALESPPGRTQERIALAIRLRLEPLYRHREAVRRALGLLAGPFSAPVAASSLWRTVDALWYAVGDQATDFNYYTKRALLAGVYGATLLYWLEDKSEGAADTWRFLDRRLDDAMRAPRALAALRDRLPPFPFFRRPSASQR